MGQAGRGGRGSRESSSGGPAAPSGVQGPGPGEALRRYPRAPVEFGVRLRFQSMREFLEATAEDLSLGGMFLRSEHLAPDGRARSVGEVFSIRFDAGGKRMVEGLCRVVRVVPPEQPGAVAGVGVEFLELEEKGRRLIEAILEIKLAQPFGD
jgi:c-di-GMP-binding flagellar brake protein YcgR